MIYWGLIITMSTLVEDFLKLGTLFLFSTVKFFIMLLSARPVGFSFIEAFITITLGGIFGVLVFYYLSGIIIELLSKIKVLQVKPRKNKSKKVFSRKNKAIVKIKVKYGLYGIAFLTPALLSIPVGVFIIRKYYSKNNTALPITCIAILLWSIAVLSSIYAC